jgi:PilZ domain
MDERRHSRRAAPAHDVEIKVAGNRPARVVDVSSEGAHLVLASALNPRGECRISLPLPNGLLRIRARVVHCRLTGFSSPEAGGQLFYHAGIQFLDVDPKLAKMIRLAYPPVKEEPVHRGPIKVKVNVDALEHAVALGKHGAN